MQKRVFKTNLWYVSQPSNFKLQTRWHHFKYVVSLIVQNNILRDTRIVAGDIDNINALSEYKVARFEKIETRKPPNPEKTHTSEFKHNKRKKKKIKTAHNIDRLCVVTSFINHVPGVRVCCADLNLKTILIYPVPYSNPHKNTPSDAIEAPGGARARG